MKPNDSGDTSDDGLAGRGLIRRMMTWEVWDERIARRARRWPAILIGTIAAIATYRQVVATVSVPILGQALGVLAGTVVFGAGFGIALFLFALIPPPGQDNASRK
jgi:hypothetical protein